MPFEARDLPEMIDLNGEIVVGPFCRHCGYPFTLHSDDGLLCPVKPNIVLGPCCDCHEIRTVEVTEWVENEHTTRRTKSGRPYRRRVTHEAQRIVRRSMDLGS